MDFKKWLVVFSAIVLSFSCTCFAEEGDQAVSLVTTYLNDMGKNILEKGGVFQRYYHPDFISLGGETNSTFIVSPDFKILKVSKTSDSHNFNHPQKEKYIAVKVRFKEIGQFDGFDVKIDKSSLEETYYCSKSTGEYQIVQSDDPELTICFESSAVSWLEKEVKTKEEYKKSLSKLKKAIGNPR